MVSFGNSWLTDAESYEKDQIEKLLTPNTFVNCAGIDADLKTLLKDVFVTSKLDPSKRSAELFENYAKSLDIKETSLTKHEDEKAFFQLHMDAMETHRFQHVSEHPENPENYIPGTNAYENNAPLLKDEIKTICDINNQEAAQEMIKFPKVNYNKLNSMLGMKEALHMTLSVKNLPNVDADLQEEDGKKVEK